jgi:hypothetical protein
MGLVEMVVIIVFLSMLTGTAHKYLDCRASIAKAQGGRGDKSVLRAVEELRAEIAALKRHESDAVLSFDSILQTLDARVKHLEAQALRQGAAPRSALGGGSLGTAEEPARLTVSAGTPGTQAPLP